MKKTISFEKKLEFPSMIGEITAISLDQNLQFVDESNITGNFKITGRYKMTEASRIEEDFSYELPVEIILKEKISLDTAKVDIEDFYYEIENDDTMICYIDVKVEGVEIIDITEPQPEIEKNEFIESNKKEKITNPSPKESRCLEEKDFPTLEKKQDLNQEHPQIEPLETKSSNLEQLRECDGEYNNTLENTESPTQKSADSSLNEEVGSLFSSFKDSDETFSTYSVYILRQEETIQTLIEKYHTTKEELEKYNDLTNLTIGTKIIIPTPND